jgi:uncharacterized membrane protein YcaP (DUF421 family)
MDFLFQFQVPPWQLIIRGTLVYWFLFLLFRFALRRDAGAFGMADILFVVLVADAAQNGLSGEYKSVGEAMLLIGTVAGWNYFIDWMAFRYPWFARFAEPRVITLVQQGKLQRENLQKELLTEEELKSHLRQNGVDDLNEVERVLLEPNGHISVLRSDQGDTQHPQQGLPGAV